MSLTRLTPRYDRLLKLAAFVEALPASKLCFWSDPVRQADPQDPTRGWVCSTPGWLPAVFPDEMRWSGEPATGVAIRGAPEKMSSFAAANLFLGITRNQHIGMFAPEGFRPWSAGRLGFDPHPQLVAEGIRQFCEWRRRLSWDDANKLMVEHDPNGWPDGVPLPLIEPGTHIPRGAQAASPASLLLPQGPSGARRAGFPQPA